MVGVGPVLGSIGLGFMLVVGIRSVSDPAKSASGFAWLGLAPPLAIAALILGLGLLVLLIRSLRAPTFFSNRREIANHAQSPFPLGNDLDIATGGVLIDCNTSIHEVQHRIEENSAALQDARPVVLVFGVHPAGLSGEEILDEAREALIEQGHQVFTAAEATLRTYGVRGSIRLFEEVDAHRSMQEAQARVEPSITVS